METNYVVMKKVLSQASKLRLRGLIAMLTGVKVPPPAPRSRSAAKCKRKRVKFKAEEEKEGAAGSSRSDIHNYHSAVDKNVAAAVPVAATVFNDRVTEIDGSNGGAEGASEPTSHVDGPNVGLRGVDPNDTSVEGIEQPNCAGLHAKYHTCTAAQVFACVLICCWVACLAIF
jgi:hypothetical protein